MPNNNEMSPLQWIRDLFPLAALVLSGLVWGMKLEGKIDREEEQSALLREELRVIRTEVGKGILPIAAEKISSIDRRLEVLEKDCLEKHDATTRNPKQ